MIHPFVSVILLDHLLCAGLVLGTGTSQRASRLRASLARLAAQRSGHG